MPRGTQKTDMFDHMKEGDEEEGRRQEGVESMTLYNT